MTSRMLTPSLLFFGLLSTPFTGAQVAAATAVGATAAAPHLLAAAPAILTGAVSSSSAHVGQTVISRLATPTALSNGSKLPVGSQLLGRITQVQSLQSGGGTSKLGMLFDHVRTPDGKDQPIAASIIRTIGSRVDQSRKNQPDAANDQGSETSSSSSNPVGGLLGGVTNAVQGTVSGAASTAGALLGTVTSLPGVLLDTAGNLRAKGSNVNIPSGTHISVEASADAQ